jgi:MFS family permease
VTWLDRYAPVLREGGVAPAFVASLVGRLSLGMTGLAVLLLVRETNGSYAAAGVVSAVYALAFALGAPARARSADRRGPVGVLLQCAILQPLALLALAVLAEVGAPVLVLAIPAAVGGLYLPPHGAVMRALWARSLPPAGLQSAYSLESVCVELCFVLGPALVAGLSALIGPAAALVASGVASMAGAVGMAMTRGVRAVRPEEDVAHGRAGPLTSPAVRALLLTVVWIGTSFGAVEVAMPAFAEENGSRPAAAGLLLAVWAFGSILGGVLYGALHSTRPPAQQMGVLVLALAIGSILPMVAPSALTMALALLLYGTTIAPFMACNALLLGAAAPRGTTTEAFAWNSSMIFAGAAIGTALAGMLADTAGATAALAVTAGAGALTLAVSVTGRRHLVVSTGRD